MKFKLSIITLLVVAMLPAIVLAQQSTVPVPGVGLPGKPSATVTTLVTDIIVGLLLPIAGIIAVLFIIIGGFQYMFAGVNEKLAERGKNTLRNAVIGLIVILLAYVIVTVTVNTLFATP
jgi:hypothetical protein